MKNNSVASISAHEKFLNRELSLLAFNQRVLAQAHDPAIPLLERLKFLCIVGSNLDEFFEVRVGGLKEQIKLNTPTIYNDGRAAKEVLRLVSDVAHQLVEEQYNLFNQSLIPELAENGICFIRRSDWNDEQTEWIKAYFHREVLPVLTPIGLDPSHPFPKLLNKSLNFAVELEGKDAF